MTTATETVDGGCPLCGEVRAHTHDLTPTFAETESPKPPATPDDERRFAIFSAACDVFSLHEHSLRSNNDAVVWFKASVRSCESLGIERLTAERIAPVYKVAVTRAGEFYAITAARADLHHEHTAEYVMLRAWRRLAAILLVPVNELKTVALHATDLLGEALRAQVRTRLVAIDEAEFAAGRPVPREPLPVIEGPLTDDRAAGV